MAYDNKREAKPSTQLVTTVAAPRLELTPDLYRAYDIQPGQWRVLVDQTFPAAKTAEAVLMALEYCRSRKLDIMKKPVHVVPMWSTALGRMVETVWPSIAEIRTTAFRTGAYAGMDDIEYGPDVEKVWLRHGEDEQRQPVTAEIPVTFPAWAKLTVYRMVHGQKCAFTARVRWLEAYGTEGRSDLPNAMWRKRPFGQIDKCVEAAALRIAFPEEVGNDYAAEEMEGKVRYDGDGAIGEVAHAEPKRRGPPPAPAIAKPKPEELEEEIIDAEIVEEPAEPESPVEEPARDEAPKPPPAPPRAPKPAPAPAPSAEKAKRTFGDFLKEVREKLQATVDIPDLEEAWAEFEHHKEKLEPVKWGQVETVYANQRDYLEAMEANTLRGG